ncbi:MAG: hypothetical protein WB509_29665 [Acetobacteraceae bacterium]|jgi:hypothetical protein
MNSLFAPVDTLDTSTYLHSVVYPNNSFALEWLMPVTGVQGNGQPITPPGFDNDYGLYLTIDASGILGQTTPTPIASQFTSINVTLWADPKNDAGTASSTVGNGATFSGPTSNDIVLATGTMVSGTMSVDPNTGIRTATDVETLNPTLEGTILLHGSIKPGEQITENFITQPGEFQVATPGDGTTVDLVNGGAATVTFSNSDGSPATISVPTDSLLRPALTFLHHPSRSHWGACG